MLCKTTQASIMTYRNLARHG